MTSSSSCLRLRSSALDGSACRPDWTVSSWGKMSVDLACRPWRMNRYLESVLPHLRLEGSHLAAHCRWPGAATRKTLKAARIGAMATSLR